MTQVETEQDRMRRGFVHILVSCFLDDATSEATALVRYQASFKADLANLFYSIFLCVLP